MVTTGFRRDFESAAQMGRRTRSVPLALQRRLNRNLPPLRVYWWRPNGAQGFLNFGDEITADIIQRLWGWQVQRSPIGSCEIVGAGSLLEQVVKARRPGQVIDVWGSAFIRPGDDVDLDGMKIHAVRGPLSARRVGHEHAALPLGDPGMLASLVYRPAPRRTHRVGVVAHFVDEGAEVLEQVRRRPDMLLIDPRQSPARVAADLTRCDLVLSSSLHGIIVAESFGIPAYWTRLSNKVAGGAYKFQDYYRGTGRKVARLDLAAFLDEDGATERAIAAHQPIEDLSGRQSRLVRGFPYHRYVRL